MRIRSYQDPDAYLNHVQSFLEENEAVNNLSLGILHRLVSQNGVEHLENKPYLSTIESDEGRIELCMIQTPPHNLTIAGQPTTSREALSYGAEELLKQKQVPGILGENHLVEIFSKEYCHLTNKKRSLHMNQRIYRLDKVIPPKQINGTMRIVERSDLELLTQWIQQFIQSMGQQATLEECRERAEQFIEEQSIVFWQVENRIVSMANQTRPTSNGMTINFVYTPPEYEKNGFASACVAELSQSLLNRGYTFCSLYTDLSNPTSNSIYMKIGFKPVGDSIVYLFES
ncbi:GNAT family N-acetyltransferase [Pseudalkalibacillus hwajinpoensis]|uniref:GNAT family N-acetyltransferase n=1 Tax=Guptibacillus hwajinpoensis TaxID=208199 RepID=A0A4U1MJ43_9BACL|nr:GNAT family N-acetyltransferase [Pseudalkalibacillus hwajinpoensis]TKD71409.1 GNAT family N-acetyltransferase [Pseudalkalibacillus hwajinpoensis]